VKISTEGISDEQFKEHLNLIRHLQHQVPSNALRVVLTDDSSVDGLVTIVSGNFFDVETLTGVARALMFGEVVRLEYPLGGE